MLVENIGQSVTMVMGSYENIKITSPEDLNIARTNIKYGKKR
ncbi:2-C-methyl-D-erythritol 4-phosphate cytidylyltransferase [Clostridioides difficile]|nr:2-C-methyl-D-erythritol 4-phosphate cytidylyltransferase [Clostridioides difficile]